MQYYEVKLDVLREGKVKNEIYVTKAKDLLLAEAQVALFAPDSEETTSVVKKKYVDVFDNPEKSDFYELAVEIDDLDSKPVKELFLVRADSTHNSKLQLLGHIDYEPEIKSVKITKVVEFINN